MDITLEKIELVKDRTGATYKEAKDALEAANGSVVDAIIAIEESINSEFDEAAESGAGNKILDKAKEIVAKGNMSRILVSKGEETIVNFPLTAGVVGAVLVPWGVIFGAIAAVGFNCSIEFVNDKGEIVDINGAVVGVYDKARDGAKKFADGLGIDGEKIDKFGDWVFSQTDKVEAAKAKSNEKVSEFVDKGIEFSEAAKEKFEELHLKEKLEDLNLKESFDGLKEQASNVIKKKSEDEEEEIQIVDENNADIEDVLSEAEEEE